MPNAGKSAEYLGKQSLATGSLKFSNRFALSVQPAE